MIFISGSIYAANVTGNVTSFTADSKAPTIKSVNPTNNAVNVPINKMIKVTFSETIKPGTLAIGVKDIKHGTYMPITKTISGNTLTITLNKNLTKATQYSIILNSGSITDLAGNKISSYSSKFTSDIPPTIKSTDPVNKAVNVPVNKVIKITFSESIKPGTLAIGVKDTCGIYMPITKTISGNTLTITLNKNLTKSTQYSIILNSGSITDISENKLSSYSSKFTTYPQLLNYLKATANCQVTNSQIKAKAASLTRGKNTTYSKAVAIYNWVRDKLGYSFYYNTKYGAVGALSKMTGNCVDTAHLVVALERAAGIPTRYVHGYCKFSSGNWYGHVWAEVYVNGKWYRADGTSTRNSFGVIKNWNTTTAKIKGVYASLPF